MNDFYKLSKYNIIADENKDSFLVFNNYTGAIAWVEKDIYNKFIENESFESNIIDGFNDFIGAGFVVSKELDEYNRVKSQVRFEINNAVSESSNFVIAPTMRCNLNCFYCFEKANILPKDDMDEEMANKVINFILKSLSKHTKHLNINWFGGEPLLKYDILIKIGKTIKESLPKHIEFSSRIITNGVLLTKERCESLVKDCNLVSAQITLDGEEKQHCKNKGASKEDYINVLQNIKDCANLLDVLVCLNSTKNNIQDMYNLSKYLLIDSNLKGKVRIRLVRVKNYTGGQFSSICFTSHDFAEENTKFFEYLQKLDPSQQNNEMAFERVRPCGVMRFTDGAIDPKGNLFKCEHMLGQESQKQGDVVNGWYYNENYMSNSMGIEDKRCSECPFYPRCGFALCIGLHPLTGKETKCNYYDYMMYRAKNYVKNFEKGGKENETT